MANTLSITKKGFDMTKTMKALLLAAAMIITAALAKVGGAPEPIADIAPLALLALFPAAWLGRGACARVKG